ncbi:MAG: CRTAC1 family protein [Myxococcales bacterium]|nr:CRTAC1 family protein [Myxococcales bacterium]
MLDEIGKLETTKDVTCWTTFRQMDAFISQKEYSHFATLAKVSATKALVRALWAKAAVAAGAAAVSADHVKAAAALPAPGTAERDSKLAAFASDKGLKAYQDYRTTSEHWRVLLAVLMDELQAGGASPLRSPDDKGLAELAEATTRLGLLLLRRAGEAAVDERTPFIEATAVQRAHDELRAKYDLRGPPLVHVERPYAEVAAQLAPLSRRLIEAKIAALHAYNRNTQDLVADMNRLANLPLDAPAVERMKQDLQSFAHFVAAGFEPMQADNFLADGQFAETALQRKAYIDAAHAENATLQLFPHLILPNGDLRLRFEPHPGRPGTAGLQGYDVHILDHEQNGVRDTAIHWLALQQVWTEKPFAMEPFAAEYLSEVLSMMATVWLRRAEALARAAGKASIGVEMMDAVRDPRFAMVLPRQDGAAPVWTADVMARKAAVFAAAGPARFEDVTHQVGLPTAVPAVPEGRKGFDIHRVMGAGIALGDIDDDGFADLFLAGEGLGRLYRNRGKAGPGVFDDATLAWGITATGLDDATQPLFLDREGDGDLDLLVLRADGATLLYEQERAGHFIERAAELGLVTHRGAHTVTAFDSDRDGDLDLYVGCYGSDAANRTQTATRNLPSLDGRNGTPHQLFRLGDDGRYTESADVAGLADTGWTLALGTFDFDRDGDLDVVLANDFGRDGLYRNDAGVFKDVSGPTRTDDRGSGMNVSFTDADGDGRLDMYVTNIDMFSKNIKVVYPNDASTIHNLDERLARAFQYIAGNKLYRNPGDDKASVPWPPIERAVFEPGDRGWAWAGVFFDWENDGDEDLYLTNGWIEGSFAADQRNQLFLQQDGRFWLAPADAAEAFAGNSRAAVAADFDGDGDVDLAVNSFRQPFRYLRNVQARGQHWIGLRLRMPGTRNPRAVGAFVEVTVAGRRQVRQVTCGGLYLGQDEGVVRVGIGAALEADVAVHWPDGRRTGWKARAGRVSDGVR